MELLQFDDIFSVLLNDLNSIGKHNPQITDAIHWFKQVSEYNVPHGKKNRGLAVVMSYRYLTKDTQHTPTNLNKARVLGWCVEFLQACFLVADDIMDHSLTRRGRPCWYKCPNVGLNAINDSLYLESAIYVLLRRYFREDECYVHLMELFHEITLNTILGQNLDLGTAGTPGDFTNFTMERYNAIVEWKTAYYSFYLPVALAMYMAGISDTDSHTNAKTILLHMGTYFQIQDDYLDCYGDPDITGKIGTDIQDNKCSWLIVQALSLADKSQRLTLEQNYGKSNAENVEKVKDVYKQLKLEDLYQNFDKNAFGEFKKIIDSNCGNLPSAMFVNLANLHNEY